MKTNRLILIVAILLTLSSCMDDEFTTTVSGKVVNFGSREPVEGAYVYLKDGVGSSGPIIYDGNTSSDKRSEVLTDANGEFTVSLTGEHAAYLGVVGPEGYQEFIIAEGGAAVGVKSYGFGGNYENQVLELKAEAGFNPLFVNTILGQPTDSLIILYQDIRRDLPANQIKRRLNSGWNTLYVGQQASRFISADNPEELNKPVAPTTGDTYTPYQIAYTRNGQWVTKIDSVYIKSFETFTDTIYY